jgi:hypothetical protein
LVSIVRASFFMAFLRSCPVRDVFADQRAQKPQNKKAARVSRGGFVCIPSRVEKAA